MLTTAERNEMLLTISDLSKDAFGYRVRHDYASMSDDELQSMWDYFMDAAQEAAQLEAKREREAIAALDAYLVQMMEDHGITYDTAIRWDLQANNVDINDRQDVEYYYWHLNLSFEDIRKFTSFALDQALVA